MSLVKTIEYQASGGESERRAYDGGEGLTIESQENGYVVAWSADAPARHFLNVVGQFVDASAKTELLPRTNGRVAIPLVEAVAAVAKHPEIKVIEVNSEDETFVWTASDPYARSRHDLTRVVMAFSTLNRPRVEQLLRETAADEVKGDLTRIIESTERLTHSTTSATA